MNNAGVSKDSFTAKSGWYDDSVLFMLDLSEGGLFVPPPPRPSFFNGSITHQDPATCDFCSWAWKRNEIRTKQSNFDIPSQAEWLFSLVAVSIVSAFIGAIAMMIFFHCRRAKNKNPSAIGTSTSNEPVRDITEGLSVRNTIEKDKIETIIPNTTEKSVCCWLSKKSSSPSQLECISCSPVENHYTQMEEHYDTDDPLYTELDMNEKRETDKSTDLYQNRAFTDMHSSSAPSSAYYSDLSVTIPEQAYEVVSLETMKNWDNSDSNNKQFLTTRLTPINENITVSSDYV